MLFILISFFQLEVYDNEKFLFITQTNYSDFVKLFQSMAILSIPMSLFLDNINREDNKNKLKIERTINFINTWREGKLHEHYISMQNVLSDICDNPAFEDIFYERYKIKTCRINEYKKLLISYLNDPKNKIKQHDFSRFRSFLSETLILVEQDYIDKNLLDNIFINEIKDVWVSCFYYYEDSIVYGDKVKVIQSKLFNKRKG